MAQKKKKSNKNVDVMTTQLNPHVIVIGGVAFVTLLLVGVLLS